MREPTAAASRPSVMTTPEYSAHPVLRRAALCGATAAVLALAACSSSSGGSSAASSSAGGSVTSHGLRITGGYVPQPASPDVAAAYLQITNTTAKPDRLQKAVTNVTQSVMAMNESDRGGVGSMTDLSTVTIPAHGTYRFVPDHAHLMLEHPTKLVAGDHVSMTLTFANAGTVKITLPVVPLGQGPSSYSSAGNSMPGMNMPGGSMSS